MKNNHEFRVPEHPVIWAMERYGEYPVPDRRRWGNRVRTSDARPYRVCEGAVEKRNFPGEEGWL